MIYLYALPECPFCQRTVDVLRRKGVRHIVVPVTSQSIADALAANYPQMRCDTCSYGLGLPFAVSERGLIGGHDDLVRYLSS